MRVASSVRSRCVQERSIWRATNASVVTRNTPAAKRLRACALPDWPLVATRAIDPRLPSIGTAFAHTPRPSRRSIPGGARRASSPVGSSGLPVGTACGEGFKRTSRHRGWVGAMLGGRGSRCAPAGAALWMTDPLDGACGRGPRRGKPSGHPCWAPVRNRPGPIEISRQPLARGSTAGEERRR
jgi:hypothetical protein